MMQVAGYAEWFNLSSLPASGLMCRERTDLPQSVDDWKFEQIF